MLTPRRNNDDQLSIFVDVDVNEMRWPSDMDDWEDAGRADNQEYQDLRGMDIEDLDEMLAAEQRFIAASDSFEEADELLEAIQEGETQDEFNDCFWGLEPGIASTVFALSTIGCAPVVSCNGGGLSALPHGAQTPLVNFYARQEHLQRLQDLAEKSGVGLTNYHDGQLQVYARSITEMMAFASAVRQSL